MKIIELLIRKANGEEMPNRVRFDNVIWNKVRGEKNIFYIDEYDNDLFIYFFRKNLDFTLNDEVEIIEEEKKIPEKLNKQHFHKKQRQLANKINEIIDYLKSKGE